MEDLRIWWKTYRRARSNSFRPKRHLNAKSTKLHKANSNGFINTMSDQSEDELQPTMNGNLPTDKEDDKSDCSDMEEDLSPWSVPSEGGLQVLWWILMWPVLFTLTLTIPNCRGPNKRLFPLTFLMSVLWIGVLSYLCSWMVTIISYTFGLPDSVAGITILAAGISVPEIIASVIVVKNGMANMALCNLIGSNIFDILFCLGLPWLIKTLAFSRTGSLVINSAALTYTTATLLSTVILLFLTLSISGWKLNFRVGVQCLVLYAAFLVIACMCELNVFGDMNPPTCPS